ncbi:MAG: right-handed parallel beta-helix repeat-containing protein [Myxococcales bacterium]
MRRSPRPVVLASVLLVLLVPAAARADLFVVRASGNDSNPGTAASPLKTIQAAVDKCSSGNDRVEVGDGSFAGFRIANKTGIEVFGLGATTIDSAPAGNGGAGIELEGVSTVTLKGLTIRNLPNAGIRVTGAAQNEHLKLVNLELDSNGAGTASNIIVHLTNDLVISQVVSSHAGRSGAYLIDVNGGTVKDSTFSNNPVMGLWAVASTGLSIERNKVFGNSTAGEIQAGITLSAVTASTVRNNLVYRNVRFGISIQDDTDANGSTDVTLAGNTVFQHDQGDFCLRLVNSTGIRIVDSIFVHAGPDSGSLFVDTSTLAEADFNLYTNRLLEGASGTAQDLASWRSSHPGLDVNSDTAGPGIFFDDKNDKFWLKSASSAGVDQGCGRYADSMDFLKAQRPQGAAYDIGCYEFPQVGPDAGMPPDAATPPGPDAAAPGLDAAQPGLDAEAPGLDAAPPGLDAEQPGLDAAEPGADAAAPGPDATLVEPDASEPDGAIAAADAGPDAGPDVGPDVGPDAGPSDVDASEPGDAAAVEPDASVPFDAQIAPPPDAAAPGLPVFDLGGCGCSAGGGGSGLALMLLGALPLLTRRGRRQG